MLGHKRIPSREGGIEIVVEELATRMVALGHEVTCYNRSGHHVSGKEFDQHSENMMLFIFMQKDHVLCCGCQNFLGKDVLQQFMV